MTGWQQPNEYKLNEQLVVFIAGPYSSSPEENTRLAILVAEELVYNKFVPIIPHLTHFWDIDVERRWGSRKTPQWWYEYDYVLLKKCDCLLRFPGESSGADNEIKLAEQLGIPVFYRMKDLCVYRDSFNVDSNK